MNFSGFLIVARKIPEVLHRFLFRSQRHLGSHSEHCRVHILVHRLDRVNRFLLGRGTNFSSGEVRGEESLLKAKQICPSAMNQSSGIETHGLLSAIDEQRAVVFDQGIRDIGPRCEELFDSHQRVLPRQSRHESLD